MVTAEDDNYSLVSVEKLEHLATGPKIIQIFPSGGHGTYLLQDRPELKTMIVDFVRKAGR